MISFVILAISKKLVELITSRLSRKHVWESVTKVSFYWHKDKEFRGYFKKIAYIRALTSDNSCQNLVFHPMTYDELRLFIDSSKRSLKCVLLRNGKLYGSISTGYSVTTKGNYEAIKKVLELICYDDRKWIICVNYKVVNFLLRLQSGYTKFPYFLCLWDSRAKDKH